MIQWLAALVILVVLVIGFCAFTSRLKNLTDEQRKLASRLAILERRLVEISAPAVVESVRPPTISATTEARSVDGYEPVRPVIPASTSIAPPAVAAAAPVALPVWQQFEQVATQRFGVWLGGIAVVIGGGLLVKFSFDHGLITPIFRVLLGCLLGLVLIGAGLRLHRREARLALETGEAGTVSLLPAVMASAGLCVEYAAIYSTYGMYGMLSGFSILVFLALVSCAGLMLGLLLGPAVTALGLVGAMINPLLVGSTTPSALHLFGYLLAIGLIATELAALRRWWWLSRAVTCGFAIWAGAWALSGWHAADIWPAGYCLLAYALACQLLLPLDPRRESGLRRLDPVTIAAGLPLVLLVPVLLSQVHALDFSLHGLFLLLLPALLLLVGVAVIRPGLDIAVWLAGLLLVGLFVVWGQPTMPYFRLEWLLTGMAAWGDAMMPAAQVGRYLAYAAGFMTVFSTATYLLSRRGPLPFVWAIAATAPALLVLCLAYLRVTGFTPSLLWCLPFLGFAVLAALACLHALRRTDTASAAVYATAVTLALSGGMVALLRDGSLTVALALQIPVLAWLDARFGFVTLRRLAAVAAVLVAMRLVLYPSVLDYPIGTALIFNWLLYGFGVPAICCVLAAWKLRRTQPGADLAGVVIEMVGLLLIVALVVLQIRHVMGGGALRGGSYSLLEQSLYVALALLGGWLCLRAEHQAVRLPLYWAGRFLLGIAVILFVIGLLIHNPLLRPIPVGDWPVFNLLLLAYGLPIPLCYLLYRDFALQRRAVKPSASAIAALLLGFVCLSLELRQAFHGSLIDVSRPTSDAEWYAYSVLWLIYGFSLLAAGIRFAHSGLRYAALLLVGVVLIKLFLFDMSNLAGLYRAASFVGLGLSLFGISYLYRRFVLVVPATSKPE